jgi:hypothetical protein
VTCTEWGYECCYEAPRKRKSAAIFPTSAYSHERDGDRSTLITAPAIPSTPGTLDVVESDCSNRVRRLEANSGAAFVRKLALKMDASRAPNLNLFGWNIGARKVAGLQPTAILPLIDITSLEHMASLAQVYFDKVDPCYGFLDRAQFFERLELRYSAPATPDIYDSVLAGVAALGCVFSSRNPTLTEIHLAHLARSLLDSYNLFGPPPIETLLAWTLRVVYLRITGTPHETWIASSTLMHLIEASGLYPESLSVLLPSSRAYCDSDLQRRIVGVAHHL